MIEFRQKKFSLFSSMLSGAGKGAGYGAGFGTLGAGMQLGFRLKKDPSGKRPKIQDWGPEAATNMLIGAGLGAFVGAIFGAVDWTDKKINRHNTVNVRLMKDVVDLLKNAGLKEGQHFTRSSKESNRLKTKVCIAISRSDGDIKVVINQFSDNKLKELNKDLIKNIPNTSAVTERQFDRNNEIIITSISDSSTDAGLVAGIAERYIHSGYPVYLVEVG